MKYRVRGQIVKSILLLLAAWLPMPGIAGGQVQLLLSGDAPYYREVAQVFTDTLAALSPGIAIQRRVVGHDDNLDAAGVGADTLLVAVGSNITQTLLQSGTSADVVSLLVPMALWQDLDAGPPHRGRRAAVVIDQPLDRALALGKLLMPKIKSASAVFGPAAQATKQQNLARAAALGIRLEAADLMPADNPIRILAPLVQNADMFVAVPDRTVFNQNVAKWVLHLAFRQQIPVIGFSKSYTAAGALASVYSSPANVGRHGAELVARLLRDDAQPTSRDAGLRWRAYYPRYYTLNTNQEVARALGIALPSLPELHRRYEHALRAME